MKVEYTEIAIKDLLEFNEVDRKLIVKKIEYLAENFEILKKSKKITELKGKFKGKYRFVVARKIRVIFQVKNNELLILILRVGKRKDVYG
jgi:mRNA interferase RelE/StbE